MTLSVPVPITAYDYTFGIFNLNLLRKHIFHGQMNDLIYNSYTEDKVVLNFHGKRFFCLTPPGVRQATRPVARQR